LGFEEIIGQQHAISALKEAFANKRIPNAYLFVGLRGVGKATTAQIFAKLLNCIAPTPDYNPCEHCNSCRKISHSNHVDVSVLEPENSTFRIDQIRELQRILRFPPQDGKMRIQILDGVECMSVESANAFLKILEEPPPGNLFLLVTPSIGQLLPTIISRCQRILFVPLTKKQLQDLLVKRHGLSPQRADLLAALAEGSVARALDLNTNLADELRSEFLSNLGDLHQPLVGITRAMELANHLKDKGAQLSLYFDLLRTWYRDLLFLREVPNAQSHIINKDFLNILHSQLEKMRDDDIYRAIRAIEDTTFALKHNAAPQLALENLFLSFLVDHPHQDN
jgi:DNA polymerase-3 subunit delta'